MFSDTLRELPFNGRSEQGSGFLPPMIRAMGHLMVLLEYVGDPAHEVTDEEIENELNAAEQHWAARALTENISTTASDRAALINTAIHDARGEFSGWDENTRIANLRDLTHRVVQFTADLDRELVGLAGSDPGTSL